MTYKGYHLLEGVVDKLKNSLETLRVDVEKMDNKILPSMNAWCVV